MRPLEASLPAAKAGLLRTAEHLGIAAQITTQAPERDDLSTRLRVELRGPGDRLYVWLAAAAMLAPPTAADELHDLCPGTTRWPLHRALAGLPPNTPGIVALSGMLGLPAARALAIAGDLCSPGTSS